MPHSQPAAWPAKIRRIITSDAALAVLLTFCLVVGGLFLGWYNNKVVPPNTDPSAHYTLESANPLQFMANWDGPIYLRLAAHGYPSLADTNFFPLYPLLIHIGKLLTGSWLDAGLLVSWLCLAGAIYFYSKIARLVVGIKDKSSLTQALLLFVLFPTAVFLLATYTESLFAFLALGALYYGLRERYLPAALFALFCTATHITGLFVLVLLGLVVWEQRVRHGKAAVLPAAAVVATGSLGILGYMLYLGVHFHQPLGFITAQKNHNWLPAGRSSLLSTASPFALVFSVLLLLAAAYWWPKRKSFSIYSLLFLLIPLVGGQFGGFNRYVLMAFPVPLMLYDWLRTRQALYACLLAAFAIGWAYFMLQYAGGYVGG